MEKTKVVRSAIVLVVLLTSLFVSNPSIASAGPFAWLIYDDDEPDDGFNYVNISEQLGVGFKLPDKSRISDVAFYIYSNPTTFRVNIYDSSASNLLFTRLFTPTTTGWCFVPVNDIFVNRGYADNDFFVTMQYVTEKKPSLGWDTDGWQYDRSMYGKPYEWHAPGPELGNFMIRAKYWPQPSTRQVPGAPASVASATGTGTVTFTTDQGSFSGLEALTSTSCGTLAGYSFPHGFFSFNIVGITPGSTTTITITLPSNMPANTQYWKCINGAWVDCTSILGDNDGDNILTLSIKDGGPYDADGVTNGNIVDPSGPGILPPAPIPAPAPVEQAEGASTGEGRSTILRSADMKARYLRVTPQHAYINQPVTVTTNVINGGGELGTYKVALKINDRVEQTRTVSVGPGSAQQVKFTVYKDKPGTYNVSIGSEKNTFTVLNGDNVATTSPVEAGMIVLLLFGALVLASILVLIIAFRHPAQ